MKHIAILSILMLASVSLMGEDQRATHTPKKHFALGYVADKGFPKGIMSFEISPFKSTPVAQSVDLTNLMIPDDDQGQVGRCTGFGLCRTLAGSIKKLTGKFPDLFSPNFVYYNERVIMGTVNEDSGAMIGDDGIRTLKEKGAAALSLWPTSKDWRQQPAPAAYVDGLKHQVLHAYKVDNRHGQDLERALSAGFPVVFGITLRASFEDLNSFNSTYVPSGKIIGGHCMTFYRYDLKTGKIWGHNQWGDTWGNHDTFDMSLKVAHSSAVDDCYVIDVVEK